MEEKDIEYDKLSNDQLIALCKALRRTLNLTLQADDILIERLRASKTLLETDKNIVEKWLAAVVEAQDAEKAEREEILRTRETHGALN